MACSRVAPNSGSVRRYEDAPKLALLYAYSAAVEMGVKLGEDAAKVLYDKVFNPLAQSDQLLAYGEPKFIGTPDNNTPESLASDLRSLEADGFIKNGKVTDKGKTELSEKPLGPLIIKPICVQLEKLL